VTTTTRGTSSVAGRARLGIGVAIGDCGPIGPIRFGVDFGVAPNVCVNIGVGVAIWVWIEVCIEICIGVAVSCCARWVSRALRILAIHEPVAIVVALVRAVFEPYRGRDSHGAHDRVVEVDRGPPVFGSSDDVIGVVANSPNGVPNEDGVYLVDVEDLDPFLPDRDVACARVGNAFARYKRTFEPQLRAKRDDAQNLEAMVACEVLNRISSLGLPDSVAVVTA
jgi:hypothetical protein